ncbi:glycosyltransferase family 2 protein [Phaeovulum sp.]|uniref:glycosyltransferase family 2 protein n=1 Tax=Phaeovulum sp. TaxID=2934796 RepID=UPI0039E4C539
MTIAGHSASVSLRVSVIIPCYNAAGTVGRALASVQAQTLTEWEAIVIDDASTDDSIAQLAPILAADPRIRLIRLAQNTGAGAARNAGLVQAQGRFVAFLDADDFWHPEKLALQTRWMAAEDLALSATAYRRVNMTTGAVTEFGLPERIGYHDLLKTNVMGFSTVIYDRNALGPRQMPLLRQRQDFAFLLMLLRELPAAGGLNRVLCTYALGHQSLSSAKGRAIRQTWRMYRGFVGLGRAPALWYFSQYAGRAILRHKAPALARTLGILRAPDG